MGALSARLTGGGVEECLVPLLDMCNHRAGSVAELVVVRAASAPGSHVAAGVADSAEGLRAEGGNGTGVSNAGSWVLRAGCSLQEGDEVLINCARATSNSGRRGHHGRPRAICGLWRKSPWGIAAMACRLPT